jgi:hypothetical protein
VFRLGWWLESGLLYRGRRLGDRRRERSAACRRMGGGGGEGGGWRALFQHKQQPSTRLTILSGGRVGTLQSGFQDGDPMAMNAALGENDGPRGIALLNRLQKQRGPVVRGWLAEGAGHG